MSVFAKFPDALDFYQLERNHAFSGLAALAFVDVVGSCRFQKVKALTFAEWTRRFGASSNACLIIKNGFKAVPNGENINLDLPCGYPWDPLRAKVTLPPDSTQQTQLISSLV